MFLSNNFSLWEIILGVATAYNNKGYWAIRMFGKYSFFTHHELHVASIPLKNISTCLSKLPVTGTSCHTRKHELVQIVKILNSTHSEEKLKYLNYGDYIPTEIINNQVVNGYNHHFIHPQVPGSNPGKSNYLSSC